MLCVANLSRFAQPVQLDLSGMEGMTPVEMLGYVEFPPITRAPYSLTLGPYGFLWLEIQPSMATAENARRPTESRHSTSRTSATGRAFSRATACGASKACFPRICSGSAGSAAKSRNIVRAKIADSHAVQRKSFRAGLGFAWITSRAIRIPGSSAWR